MRKEQTIRKGKGDMEDERGEEGMGELGPMAQGG